MTWQAATWYVDPANASAAGADVRILFYAPVAPRPPAAVLRLLHGEQAARSEGCNRTPASRPGDGVEPLILA